MTANPHRLEEQQDTDARIEHIATHPLPPLTRETAEHMADIFLEGQHLPEMAERLAAMTDNRHTLRSLTGPELLIFTRATAETLAGHDQGTDSPLEELMFGLLVRGVKAPQHLEHALQMLLAADGITDRAQYIDALLRADH